MKPWCCLIQTLPNLRRFIVLLLSQNFCETWQQPIGHFDNQHKFSNVNHLIFRGGERSCYTWQVPTPEGGLRGPAWTLAFWKGVKVTVQLCLFWRSFSPLVVLPQVHELRSGHRTAGTHSLHVQRGVQEESGTFPNTNISTHTHTHTHTLQ